MIVDPLSEFLSLLRPRDALTTGVNAGENWSIGFGGQRSYIKCYVILSGECWLMLEGEKEGFKLVEGDCFVVPNGRAFRLASDLSLPPVSAAEIFPGVPAGGTAIIAGGGSFSMVVSRFAVYGRSGDTLLGLLPPLLPLRGGTERAALHWSLHRMMDELRDGLPGGDVVAQDLAHMMLVHALRAYLAAGPGHVTGWFSGLADKKLNLAIKAMHADPARRWSLQELGEIAGMSRSVFALRFKETVGETPMQYLVRWRMLLACDRLENVGGPISVVADDLGYESESAFGAAFKRVLGSSPREYMRRARMIEEAVL
ncbi:AraC family transcriptional regulator [Burkholderia metallica]|uniref:AraC family transcriptional regulator n=1 Tax=Burkholderia metallica TaxID=488729 RepID=UPI001C2CF32D|nr:AraC family transcriptional regulator [Burkholderia metallica]